MLESRPDIAQKLGVISSDADSVFVEETISANEESLVADLKDDEGSIDNVPGDLEAQEKEIGSDQFHQMAHYAANTLLHDPILLMFLMDACHFEVLYAYPVLHKDLMCHLMKFKLNIQMDQHIALFCVFALSAIELI